MPALDLSDLSGLRADLLAWSERTRRSLPWRDTRDPWAVLVSELMLQQTQVARVIPRYEAFLDRWPAPVDCAAAPQADVVRMWAGLGYNRRAVQLWRAAREIVLHHGGRVPDELEALIALPGVGAYTARAVLAFAFERDVGVVDTNAARVLARVSGRTLRAAEAQTLASSWVPPGAGWAWNQAMLDVGSAHCRSEAQCRGCPLAAHCRWNQADRLGPDPARGSAGVSGSQSPFTGSDRQGRGRLVDALRREPVHARALAAVMGWPEDRLRARRVARGLVDDGMVVVERGWYRLV